MRPFSYERARSPSEATAAAARVPGAKFIAGGTNLLDLMKLEIENPPHLVDLGGLGLDKIEAKPDGGRGLRGRLGAFVAEGLHVRPPATSVTASTMLE